MRGKQRPPGLASPRPSAALVAVPLVLIVAIVATDLLTGPGMRLGTLLVVAPALTASIAGPRLVTLTGAVAIGAHMVTVHEDEWNDTRDDTPFTISLIAVTILAVAFTVARDRRHRELVRVHSVADAVQRALMRPLPERLGALAIASLYLTAEQEARVGGDLYAAVRVQGGTRLIIGDVRGKGLAAIDAAALIVAAFRTAAHEQAGLPDVVHTLDRVATFHELLPDDEPGTEEDFITMIAVEIPDDLPVVRVINRGHPPPLLINGRGILELGSTPIAPPLGLSDLHPSTNDITTYTFRVQDILVLYTDGITESRDRRGRFYPLRERLAARQTKDPELLLDRLHADITAFAGGHLDDDAALIAAKRLPG